MWVTTFFTAVPGWASWTTRGWDGTRCEAGSVSESVDEIAAPADFQAGLAADFERCASITRESSSNFYYAFKLLPAPRRRALYATYAFCRFVDDIADDEQ